MQVVVTVRDESIGGKRSDPIELAFPTERITVRELIRERIYQDVQDYNRRVELGPFAGSGPGDASRLATFRGLIQPSESETAPSGFRVRHGRQIDWKDQFTKACEAFEKNGMLVLVGDRQTESLDETITLSRGVEVTFLKLVLLVGG